MLVYTVNMVSSDERLKWCAGQTDEEASLIFDKPIRVLFVWHFIEWVRTILYLVTIMIGVNFMHVYYVLNVS